MIEQVKGFSYPATSLLGEKTFLPMAMGEDMIDEEGEKVKITSNSSRRKSWWRISFASPKVQDPIQTRYFKFIFCFSFFFSMLKNLNVVLNAYFYFSYVDYNHFLEEFLKSKF